MRTIRVVGASAVVLAVLIAAGCDDANGANGAQSEPTGESAQTDTPQDDGKLDAAACGAVSDVQSIFKNADIAVSEGRMTVQEQQGWYQLATRALHRIPSGGHSAVDQGVSALQESVPEIAAGARAEAFDFTTDVWNDALATLAEPCLAANSELSISMFTGG